MKHWRILWILVFMLDVWPGIASSQQLRAVQIMHSMLFSVLWNAHAPLAQCAVVLVYCDLWVCPQTVTVVVILIIIVVRHGNASAVIRPFLRSFILLSNCLEMNDAKMLKRFPCFSFYGIRFLLLRPLFKFVFIRWHSKTKFLFVCEKASFSPLSFTQWWRWSSGHAAEAGSCIGAGASIVDGSVVHSTVSLTSLIITLWLVVGCLCCRCPCCCCCMPVSHSLPWGENLVAASYCNCSRWFSRCGF